MTDEQMRDMVERCGLDWYRGYMPFSYVDQTNRYAMLIKAVEEAERERWQQQCAGKRHAGCAYLATCGSVCNKCGRVA